MVDTNFPATRKELWNHFHNNCYQTTSALILLTKGMYYIGYMASPKMYFTKTLT